MYNPKSTEKLNDTAKAGGILISPPTVAFPTAVTPLVAVCDGCGAQIYLDPKLKVLLSFEEHIKTHRTYCLACLQVRKVL